MRDAGARWASGLTAALATGGAALVIVALAGLPHPWIGGYVSEAGVGSYPRAWLYRLGIAGLSAGMLLLGIAVARMRRLAAAALLVTTSALGFLSASVSCSVGCPLPPYEHATVMDLVHAGASSLAVGLATLAMLVIGWAPVRFHARRVAQIGFVATAPVLATLGICLLAIGRSTTTAVLERVVLAEVFAWLLATAITLGRTG